MADDGAGIIVDSQPPPPAIGPVTDGRLGVASRTLPARDAFLRGGEHVLAPRPDFLNYEEFSKLSGRFRRCFRQRASSRFMMGCVDSLEISPRHQKRTGEIALDVVVLVTTVAAAYAGWRLGILRAGMAVFGAAAGIVLAKHATPHVTPYVGRIFNEPEMAQAVSVLTVVVGVLVASIVAGAMLRRAFKFLFLAWLDASSGAIAGFTLLLVMWSACLNGVVPNLGDEMADAIERTPVAGTLLRKGPDYLEIAPDFVKDYAVARIP